jgi:hypothetical protein
MACWANPVMTRLSLSLASGDSACFSAAAATWKTPHESSSLSLPTRLTYPPANALQPRIAQRARSCNLFFELFSSGASQGQPCNIYIARRCVCAHGPISAKAYIRVPFGSSHHALIVLIIYQRVIALRQRDALHFASKASSASTTRR